MQLKVAIADDNRQNLMNLKMMCEKEFFSVLTARDGIEMKRIIENYHPDVIITDLIMPDMNGLQVARMAKSKRSYSPIVIVMSGIRSQRYIDRAFSNGADYYITKPVDKNKLRNILLEISRICKMTY